MEKPLVSILIPAYNAEEWIAETIRSAIAQTWPRKEIIVVDDGSRDQTAEVARRFASKQVAVVSKGNQGAAATRNYAFQMCQGDYIQWLDADDLLAADKIERQLAALRDKNCPRTLLSSAWGRFAYRTRRARFVPTALWQDLSPVEWLLRKMGDNLYMQTATWLTSRELADTAGPWDTRLHVDDDGEYFCRVLMASESTRFVPEAKVFYRITPSTRVSFIGGSDRKKEALLVSMKLHVQYLRSLEESERTRKACLNYLQTWYPAFYSGRADLTDELQDLATQLGGHLEPPRLCWKYAWMKPVFGWKVARWAQDTLPNSRASSIRLWDKVMYRLETQEMLGHDASCICANRQKQDHGLWTTEGQWDHEIMSKQAGQGRQSRNATDHPARSSAPSQITVTLLTGGIDKHYSFGLASALQSKGVAIDVIGSDDLDCQKFRNMAGVNFINLRGSQRTDASLTRKVIRLSKYYARLIGYASRARTQIFHILWNNRLETFDRTLLMLYYRLLGKRIVLTAHNVNAGRRDLKDSALNRLTLRIQYRLAHNVFVHTEKMKCELIEEFGMPEARVALITYGINNAVPDTGLTPRDAKRRIGMRDEEKVILFFGRITPYKGLEHLVTSFHQIVARDANYRLIIAGMPQKCDGYWSAIWESVREDLQKGRVLLRAEYIPDDETEVYFKAADVFVLPYRHIYQSGILFLGYCFGLPVLAADVGSLKDEVVEGQTGFVFRPEDPSDLARAIECYFASDLYASLDVRRQSIRDYAAARHSWDAVGRLTTSVYTRLLQVPPSADSKPAGGPSLGAAPTDELKTP